MTGGAEATTEVARISGMNPDAAIVARAVELLRAGRLLIYPTDTLYALGGMALDAEVVQRVVAAKLRASASPLPLIAADEAQARALSAGWSSAAQALARRFWPGPLTLVLPGGAGLPRAVRNARGGVAVRVPALTLARELCQGAGPLVSTSANPSGSPAPDSCEAALRAVGRHVSLALDAGPAAAQPSTIVDTLSDPPRLLRAGQIPWEAIQRVLDSETLVRIDSGQEIRRG